MVKLKKVLNLIMPFIAIGCVLLVWSIAALSIDSEYILPTVTETLEEFIALFVNAKFYLALFSTMLRSLIAFLVSFMFAFPLAIITVKLSLADKFIDTLISVIRALPTIAIVLILLFWTTSKVAPVIVTTLVVMPTCYTQIVNAFKALDKTVAEAGRVDGADEFQVFKFIELPQIAYALFITIGSGISLSFKLMVAAEVIAQTANSIGFMLNTSKAYFEISQMLALVCVSVIFGVVVEFIFNYLSKKVGSFE